MDRDRKGRFFVSCYPHNSYFELLKAAQEGCAVTRCEYLAHRDEYEVYAVHPDFLPLDKGSIVPTYDVIFDDAEDAAPVRLRFEKTKEG